MKDYVHTLFNYDPITGDLTWKIHLKYTKTFPGDLVGCLDNKGYQIITITFQGKKKAYKAHRIIWLMVTGAWPTRQLDHRNSIKNDNAWSNLFLSSSTLNSKNRKLSTRNTSGVIGVCQVTATGKWFAYAGTNKYLGNFATKTEAIAARKQAELIDGTYGPSHGLS